MEKVVILKINTRFGMIEIPFLDLEALDYFTVRYNNADELISALSKMLSLSLKKEDVLNVCVYCEYVSRKNLYTTRNLNVKYRGDNFNLNTLEGSLFQYLSQDHSRILKCGVRDIRTKAMYEFISGKGRLSDFDIKDAIRKYLTNAPYRTFRKIYFMIKDHVRVDKNRVVIETRDRKKDKASLVSSEDDYLDSILNYARLGEEELARAMDELSRVDLEDLRDGIIQSNVLFDGMHSDNGVSYEDLYDLSVCTGYDVDDLAEAIARNRKKGFKK